MATTDPFGTSTPGGTSSITPQAAAPAKYQYAGKGWEDPLAQEIAKKYMHDPSVRTSMWNPAGADDEYRRLKDLSDMYHKGGSSGGGYQDPLTPTNWGASGVYTQDQADKMKAEYISKGGMGTYEQLAATDPTSVGWTAGAGRINTSTGQMEYPQATGGWSSTLNSAGQSASGSGSTNALSSDVLSKMWR